MGRAFMKQLPQSRDQGHGDFISACGRDQRDDPEDHRLREELDARRSRFRWRIHAGNGIAHTWRRKASWKVEALADPAAINCRTSSPAPVESGNECRV